MKISEILTNPVDSEQLLKSVRSAYKNEYDAVVKRAAYMAENFPSWKAQIIAEADMALEEKFVLSGTDDKPYFVGDPPKWFENPCHNNEFVWGLNRHYYFEPLTTAYHVTGDRRYAERVIRDLTDWIDNCPIPEISDDYKTAKERFDTVSPWRSLEVGIRTSSSWYNMFKGLICTEFFTPDILEKFVISVYEHGLVLREETPIFWPRADHNHYLHEMFGLLCVSVMFPELKTADEWRAFSIKELERCIKVQFSSDGGQIECSTGYHDVCLRMLYECLDVAKMAGITLPALFYDTVDKAAEYSAFTVKPDATRAALGDSDLEISAIPKLIALQFGTQGKLGKYENIIGLLDDGQLNDCICNYATLYGDVSEFKSALDSATSDLIRDINYQKELCEVFYRSGWDRDADYLLASCLTPVPSGHAHIDPMTFDLSLGGKSVVIDPGRYTYAENEMRRMFKSPQYHSTITLNDKPPFEYLAKFEFYPQKDGFMKTVFDGDIFGADAVQFNFEPAVHKRLFCMVDDGLFAVLDDVYNPGFEDVRIYYHINSTELIDIPSDNRIAINDLAVNVYYSDGLSADILDGCASPHHDFTYPTKRIELTDLKPCDENKKYLTVFSSVGEIKDVSVIGDGEYTCVRFTANNKQYGFRYIFGKSLERI